MGFQPFPVFGRGLRRGFGRGNDGGEHTTSMQSRILNTQAASLIAYWKLDEISGTQANDSSSTGVHGVYTGAFTLNEPGIGDGSKSAKFGAAAGRVSLATNLALLDAVMDKTQGTLFLWAKVANAAIWTDANSRRALQLGADVNNRLILMRSAGGNNNELTVFHQAGGTTKTVNIPTSTLNWFSIALTWNKAADQVKAYFNGLQTGATQTGLGVWAGALASVQSAIADLSSAGSGNFWSGWLAHVAVWKVTLSDVEIRRLGIL